MIKKEVVERAEFGPDSRNKLVNRLIFHLIYSARDNDDSKE